MAIDTAEKRKAACAAFLLLCAPGVTPNASPDAEWRQEALWSYPGIAAASSAIPEDPDDDVAVTARTDHNDATIRPPRLTIAHRADSLLEADFTGHDRLPTIDRHRARSSRSYRLPNIGNRFEIQFESVRAGEAFALQRMIAWISPEAERPVAVNTTNRTDVDSATLGVPVTRMWVAADGSREADADTLDATVQDRWVARYAVPSAQGLGQFFEVGFETAGRAGESFAIDRIVLWIEDRAESRPPEET